MLIIKYFVAFVWAIFGLLIWIPILFRVIFIYIFHIFFLTVKQKEIIANNHIALLVNTSAIYRKTFENIFKEGDGVITPPNEDNPQRSIWFDLLWSVIFWGSIITPFLI